MTFKLGSSLVMMFNFPNLSLYLGFFIEGGLTSERRYFQFDSVQKKCSKSLFLFFFNLKWTSKNNPFHVWLKKYLYISNSLKQSQICKKLLTHQHQKWKKKEKMRSLFNPRVVLRSYTVIYFWVYHSKNIKLNKKIAYLWISHEIWSNTEVLAVWVVFIEKKSLFNV